MVSEEANIETEVSYNDTPSESLDELKYEIIHLANGVRSVAIRRLLMLWFECHGNILDWTFKHTPEPQRMVTPEAVQELWGCSRRTAYDYIAAVKALGKINELGDVTFRQGMMDHLRLLQPKEQTNHQEQP